MNKKQQSVCCCVKLLIANKAKLAKKGIAGVLYPISIFPASQSKLVSCMIVCFCDLDLTNLAHAGVSPRCSCDDVQASFPHPRPELGWRVLCCRAPVVVGYLGYLGRCCV